jgi:hypothetical protein
LGLPVPVYIYAIATNTQLQRWKTLFENIPGRWEG